MNFFFNTVQLQYIFIKRIKIQLQQNGVLSVLFAYANPDNRPSPRDATPVMATHGYLSAVQKIFEEGFLQSKRDGSSQLRDLQAQLLESIQQGYKFFKDWWTQLDDTSMC